MSIDMAKWLGADLHWISIKEGLPHGAISLARESRTEQEESRYFQRIVDEARQAAHKEGITLHPHILPGHEVETVVRFVREHKIDLLVIGFEGALQHPGSDLGPLSH